MSVYSDPQKAATMRRTNCTHIILWSHVYTFYFYAKVYVCGYIISFYKHKYFPSRYLYSFEIKGK